jgi:hypothetical protein
LGKKSSSEKKGGRREAILHVPQPGHHAGQVAKRTDFCPAKICLYVAL